MIEGRMNVDLVLEGGGVKGIGLVGAITRLNEEFAVARVAGSSVGALVGALVAAGYSGEELEQELCRFPFERVKYEDPLDRVPVAGPLISLAIERGVWETTAVRGEMVKLLQRKGVRTFRDLRLEKDESSTLPPKRQYGLVVTATDVTTGELLYLPWDYEERLGLDPDEQCVADAVAASIAIPFFFEPVELKDADGVGHRLVDGGVLSNFPISIFDRTDREPPRWPTIGLKIIPRLPVGTADLFPPARWIPVPGFQHLIDVATTAVVGRDQTFLSQPCVAARTIQIDTSAAGVVDFDLPDTDKRELRDKGWLAADEFLDGWDWDDYVATCRS